MTNPMIQSERSSELYGGLADESLRERKKKVLLLNQASQPEDRVRTPLSGRRACLLLTLPLLLATGLQAQQPKIPAPPTLTPQGSQELQINPLAALRAFEPSAQQEYELGRGDEISIDFGGHPELSVKRIVGPDGKITLPLAGSIELADKTRDQAADVILKALGPFYSQLSVTVGVDKYTSNHVLLLGAVAQPGIVSFDAPPTLLEVVTKGGVLGGTGSNFGSIASSGGGGGGNFAQTRTSLVVPERCAIYRGSDKVMWVDLKALLDSGSPLADLRLKRNDVVYVPSPLERYVSVLGQVQHPGALQLDNNTTLPKLLAEAGGITPQAGQYPEILIVSAANGSRRTVSFKTLLQPGAVDLSLKSGDVIYVPETGFNRATYVLERLSPLVTMFTAAAFFTQ